MNKVEVLYPVKLTGFSCIALQTTIIVLNMILFQQLTPNALMAWHQVRLANWLAASGEEWAGYFRCYNLGTYNNQYMILDMEKIE